MSRRFSELRIGDYPADVVASCVQKSIRRSQTYETAFWSSYMARHGYAAYAWKRLAVIASEDVGPGSNDGAMLVHALYENALLTIGKRRPKGEEWKAATLHLVHAAVALAKLPKTRAVPELISICDHRDKTGEHPPIPSYALDVHTREGRAKGLRRGSAASLRHWQREGRIIEPDVAFEGNRWRDLFDEIAARERGLSLELPLDPDEPDR